MRIRSKGKKIVKSGRKSAEGRRGRGILGRQMICNPQLMLKFPNLRS